MSTRMMGSALAVLLVLGATASAQRGQGPLLDPDVAPAGGPDGAGSLPSHVGTGIDSDEDGMLPAKYDLTFKHEVVDGFAFDVGVWHSSIGLDFGVVLDPLGGVTVTLAGDSMVTGTAEILDDLPGGQEAATAGSTGCWDAPGPVSGPVTVSLIGEGPTLGAAVADYKDQVAELQDLGYTPLPSGACDPQPEPHDGPMGHLGHP